MLLVGVVMGSKSDNEVLQPMLETLKQLGIEHEVNVISAPAPRKKPGNTDWPRVAAA